MFKNKLISDTLITTGTSFLIRFITFIRGFIVARLLDPSLYGYFSGLSLIFLYNAQGHLGILHGMNRSLSISKGAKSHQSFDEVKNNGVSAIAILSLIISGGILLYSFVKADVYSTYVIWGIRIYAIVGVLYHMEYVYHSLFRVDHRFKEINISRLIFASSNIILVVLLIYLFGFYGVLFALLGAVAIQNTYLFVKGKFKFKLVLNPDLIKDLLKTGAPISFAYLTTVILNSVDRIMIIRFLSSAELGFYAIGLTLSAEFLLRIPDAISYVIYPRILEEYGKSGDTRSLLHLFRAPSVVLGCVMAVAIGLLFLSIDYLIIYLLPNYIPAIEVTRILIFSVYFVSINQIAVRVIITTKRTKALILFQVMAIFLNTIANYIAIQRGMGIRGVALATALSYFVYSFSVTHYALKKLHGKLLTALKEQCKLYLPLIYCSIALILLSHVPYLNSVISKYLLRDAIMVGFRIMTFLLILSPFLFYHNRMADLRGCLRMQG